MYGKIFESMYDGTLSADWKAMVTFQQLIVLADKDGVIDITPPALSRRTGIPIDIIDHGLKKLAEPDPYSRSDVAEGRRIELIDDHRPWGWRIVNYDQYRAIASQSDQREQARIRKQRQRERQASENGQESREDRDKIEDVTPCHAPSRMSRHTDTDTDSLSVRAKTEIERSRADETEPDRIARQGLRKPAIDFWPRESEIERMAEERGFSVDDVIRLTLMFRDTTFTTPLYDPHGRWRNFIRRERGPPSPSTNGKAKPSRYDQLFAGTDG